MSTKKSLLKNLSVRIKGDTKRDSTGISTHTLCVSDPGSSLAPHNPLTSLDINPEEPSKN